MDIWLEIEEFPQYEVSDRGDVRNKRTGRILKPLDNGRESLVVILRRDGVGHTRSIRRLVAIAFFGEPFGTDVAIPIDGDYMNNAVDNLVWKPRWFAQGIKKQRRRSAPLRNLPIRCIETGKVFLDSMMCARAYDVLEEQIVLAVGNPGSRYIKGHSFEYA